MRISDLVLHNDHQLIALNKPGAVPTQDDKTGDKSLHTIAQAYCKRDLFIINRLDRPCSGIVIFAKTQAAAAHLSEQWQQRTIRKTYLAIISKGLAPDEGTLHHFIFKKGNKSIATPERPSDDALEVSLSYHIMKHLDNYDLVSIHTHTGYYHQIRAQLSAAGFPVKDDVKYGARRSNKERTIFLHCSEIALTHPGNGEQLILKCAPDPSVSLWNP